MATTSRSPRFLKGALVVVDPYNPATQPVSIVFQYNPQELTHSLSPNIKGEGPGERKVNYRFTGAPDESFSLQVIIDATDGLERGDRQTSQKGIYPQLNALETLLYPKSEEVDKYDDLLADGSMEIGGALFQAPLLLFVWGEKRVVPVTLTSMEITEKVFDSRLNPIHAEVTLNLQALTYSDLQPSHPGYKLFLAYQRGKERLGRLYASEESQDKVTGVNVRGMWG